MVTLLVVDASSTLCSVALSHQGQCWQLVEAQPRRQAQLLLPMVDRILHQAGIEKSALQGIAYGCGPGSFTGLRIAAAVAQGLALALALPIYGISSLQGLAQAVFASSDCLQVRAMLNAHMGEVFWGLFERDGEHCRAIGAEQVGAPQLCLTEMLNHPATPAGDALLLPEFQHIEQRFAQALPQALPMLSLAQQAWQQGLFGDIEQHLPVYLRNSVAWKKLDEQPSLLRRES